MVEDPSAPSDEPGAPIPKDAVDPELLRLEPPRLRRHPLLSLSVLLLGSLLLYQLQKDIAYGLQSSAPTDLSEARDAVQSGRLRAGTHVTLSGMPDYRNALGFDARGERHRSYLFRLLGTGNKVMVVTQAQPSQPAQDVYRNQFTGRLRRFDDLPFAATVRDYYMREARVLRALDMGKLRERKDFRPPVPVPDRAGEVLTLAPDREVFIDVLFPDDLRVLLSRDKFPSEPDARHEVERLGLPAGPGVETRDGYGYVLRLPEAGPQRNQAIARVDAQGFLLLRRVEVYRAPASALQVQDGGLSLPGPDRLPQPVRYMPVPSGDTGPKLSPTPPQPGEPTVLFWADIQAVQVSEPLSIPPDAFVLLDGESPGRVRFALPLAALLLLFMAFNLWYLWKSTGANQRENR